MEEKKYVIVDSFNMVTGPLTEDEVKNEIQMTKDLSLGGVYKVYELKLKEIHNLEVKIAHHIDTFV